MWAELRAHGPLGPMHPADAEDVAAVARETMRRAARHVDRIAEALPSLGISGRPGLPPRRRPDAVERAEVDALAAEIGGLPAALEACLREIGHTWFAGDYSALRIGCPHGAPVQGGPPGPAYPDPLCLPDAARLRWEWDLRTADPERRAEEQGFVFDFAPDEYHKAGVSGAAHTIVLPDRRADPVLRGVAGRPGVTLVEYLRASVAWGGFPGWEFGAEPVPDALRALRAVPDF
ncbi:hypothetical protein DEF23_07035 [Marinitenerispora sediminis]|uniref:Uncharacterized protein n=1 Tax=Marinitenerispora sediminis TaxID=1931232 RepID=A0A368T1E6_9ACTN|nr:hypothetical protein DEF24_19800 [Marinitenerispora sediminis]RCV57785.1 hypothetical protein DEF28_01065 [Marinitenerispora sediminis]RCV59530.1 hypothetical protein DEF23_07035 [Marinitenerispora sediminis]